MADAPVPERDFDSVAVNDESNDEASIEVALKSFKRNHSVKVFFTTDKVFKIEATVDTKDNTKVYSIKVPALKEEDIKMPPKIEKFDGRFNVKLKKKNRDLKIVKIFSPTKKAA